MSGTSKEAIKLSEIDFRRMSPEDIPAVLEIERKLFTDAWNYDHFLHEITEHVYSVPITAEYKNEIIAYIIGWAMFEEFHIANIAVAEKYHRLGIAECLMQYIEWELVTDEKTMMLEVRTSNLPAIRLYEKVGFRVFFERRKFYPDGEDAYVMIKFLKNGE